MTPLGALADVLAAFGRHNTAPDGSAPKRPGAQVLYGPGMVVEASVNKGEVTQAMVSVSDVGIIISNGKGAIINMTGPTTDVNVGALTVI